MIDERDIAIRRLRMRSMRRGIKEMDLILSTYAEARLAALGPDDLALYEALLFENDQDLYRWVGGRTVPPERFRVLIDDIAVTMARSARADAP